MSTEHDVNPIAEPVEERITLRMQVHTDAPSHGIVLREGPKPTRIRGRIPRIARLLALAHHFQELLDTGVVRTQMELAELTKLTTARITQIMNLLILAPDIQEEILFMRHVTRGEMPVTEKTLRPVLQTLVWSEQRQMWAKIREKTLSSPENAENRVPKASYGSAKGHAYVSLKVPPVLCIRPVLVGVQTAFPAVGTVRRSRSMTRTAAGAGLMTCAATLAHRAPPLAAR